MRWRYTLPQATDRMIQKWDRVRQQFVPVLAPEIYWSNMIVDICRVKAVGRVVRGTEAGTTTYQQIVELGKGNNAVVKDGCLEGYDSVNVSWLELIKLDIFLMLNLDPRHRFKRLIPSFKYPRAYKFLNGWFSPDRGEYPRFIRVLRERVVPALPDDPAPETRHYTRPRKEDNSWRWAVEHADPKTIPPAHAYEGEIPNIEPEEIPAGMSYEWKDIAQNISLHLKNGWKYVPASRHPGLPHKGKRIIISGNALMERPKDLTNAARQEDYDAARKQVDAVLQQSNDSV